VACYAAEYPIILLFRCKTAVVRLLERLSYFHALYIGYRQAFSGLFKFSEIKKGTQLVSYGKRQDAVWFLYKGTAKAVSPCDDNGRRRGSWFSSDFLFSYSEFFNREPAITRLCPMLQSKRI
jgi:hypothetical protein